jgi:hypothetical protein
MKKTILTEIATQMGRMRGGNGTPFGKPQTPNSRWKNAAKINTGKIWREGYRVPCGWRYGPLAGLSELGNQFSGSENQTNCY